MNHQLTNQVKLLQKALLVCDEEFLILKRSADSLTRPNNWDLPGGNSEWPVDATPIQSAAVTLSPSKGRQALDDTNYINLHQADLIREIKEETGVVVNSNQIGYQPIYFGTYFENQKQVYSIIVGWKVSLPAKPIIKISSEHREFQWIKPSEFDHFEFGFAGKKSGFIRQIVNNLEY